MNLLRVVKDLAVHGVVIIAMFGYLCSTCSGVQTFVMVKNRNT